jgi:hypothetical protein
MQLVADPVLEPPVLVWLESMIVKGVLKCLQPPLVRSALCVGGFRPPQRSRTPANVPIRLAADRHRPSFSHQQLGFTHRYVEDVAFSEGRQVNPVYTLRQLARQAHSHRFQPAVVSVIKAGSDDFSVESETLPTLRPHSRPNCGTRASPPASEQSPDHARIVEVGCVDH